MASPLPSPLAAAIGVVPAVLDGVRRLPGRAVQLPVLAVSNALSTMDALRREYDDLAERGERLVARLRGEAIERADALEDTVEDALARTPFATAYDKTEDALENAVDTLRRSPESQAPIPAAEAPKGAPTPRATPPASTHVDTAASPAVVRTVERAAASTPASAPLTHDQLPLPDYDHMTLGSLRGRMRAMSLEHLMQVRTYEKAHADRLPIVTMLDNRIAKLATDAAATRVGPFAAKAPTGRPAPAALRPSQPR